MANVIATLPDTPCTFTFKVEGCAIGADVPINDLSTLKNVVYNNGGYLILSSLEPELFNNDLMIIESCLPQLLAHLLIKFGNTAVTELSKLIAWLEDYNPLKFNQSLGHKFYEYKIINFLVSIYEGAGIVSKLDYKSLPKYLIENARLCFDAVDASAIDIKSNTLSVKSIMRIDLYA